MSDKSLDVTSGADAAGKVGDIKFFGDPDTWRLICKASSKSQGWMKSTKAMEVPGCGCLVQVTTQQRNPDCPYALSEAVTFAPGAGIFQGEDGNPILASASWTPAENA